MNCKVLNGVLWKWQIQLSSIKQMAITFENTTREIRVQQSAASISSKKIRLDSYTATCSAITQDGIEFGNHHEIYRTDEKQ
jgi:hypothetical protein